jgi:hypothetical protein
MRSGCHDVQARSKKDSNDSQLPLRLQVQSPDQRDRYKNNDRISNKVRHQLRIRQHLRIDALSLQLGTSRRPPDADMAAACEDNAKVMPMPYMATMTSMVAMQMLGTSVGHGWILSLSIE